MSRLFFRKAGRDDVPAIVALINSAYRGDSGRTGWTTEADFLGGQRTDAAEVEPLVTKPDSTMLLCLRDTDLVGCVHVERSGSGAYLGMLTVKPALQARGIGKQLLQAAERVVRDEWGADSITMAVITRRTELIAFYERRGYRRTGERMPFPQDPRFGIPKVSGLEFELLRKDLTPAR